MTLAAQLASIQSEIKSVQRQIVGLKDKAEEFRRRIETGPKVDEDYKTLTIERHNTQMKYDDLMQKLWRLGCRRVLRRNRWGSGSL